jgi:hypothetical protein
MGRSLPKFTPEDLARAKRALEVYGSARLAILIEFPTTWPLECEQALRNRVNRAAPGSLPDPPPLRIDTDPEAVLEIWQTHGAGVPVPVAIRDLMPAIAPHAPSQADPTDAEVMRLERRVATLEDEARRLKKKLKASFRRETFGEAIAAVIADATPPLPAVGAPAVVRSRSASMTPVDAVAILSDEHADEVVTVAGSWGMEDYDFDIFRVRLERWAEKIVRWIVTDGWLPAHSVERLVVAKLGDAINGSIHDAEFRNHFGNSIRAALATGDAEAHALQFIRRETGVEIDVIALSGNHPRTSVRKDYHDPHANLDFLVATQIATRLQGQDGVSVHIPRAYTALVDVRGHLFAMNHGDDVRGSSFGIPWYGFTRRNTRVQAMTASVGERVGYFLYGHYHTPAKVPTAGAVSYHNGAFPATSPYALESLAAGNEPSQTLLIVDEPHGVQMEVPIYLRDSDAEARFREGTFAPAFGGQTILDDVDASSRRQSGLVKII